MCQPLQTLFQTYVCSKCLGKTNKNLKRFFYFHSPDDDLCLVFQILQALGRNLTAPLPV